MPSKSKSQQRLFGMVHAYQTGKLDADDLSDDVASNVKKVAGSISKSDAKDFASTKLSKLPQHVKESDVRSMRFKTFLSAVDEEV